MHGFFIAFFLSIIPGRIRYCTSALALVVFGSTRATFMTSRLGALDAYTSNAATHYGLLLYFIYLSTAYACM